MQATNSLNHSRNTLNMERTHGFVFTERTNNNNNMSNFNESNIHHDGLNSTSKVELCTTPECDTNGIFTKATMSSNNAFTNHSIISDPYHEPNNMTFYNYHTDNTTNKVHCNFTHNMLNTSAEKNCNYTYSSSVGMNDEVDTTKFTENYINVTNYTAFSNKSNDYRINNKNKNSHRFSLMHLFGWLLLFGALTMLTVVLLNWFMRRRQQRWSSEFDNDDEELLGGNYLGEKRKKGNKAYLKEAHELKSYEQANEHSPLSAAVTDHDSRLTGDLTSSSNLSQNSLHTEGNTSRQRFLEARRAAAVQKNYGAIEDAHEEEHKPFLK